MLHYIETIVKVEPYKIICQFNNKEFREFDLKDKIFHYSKNGSEIFKQLEDPNYFKTVKLDSYGTLFWDNNVDFCPDVLFEMSNIVAEQNIDFL